MTASAEQRLTPEQLREALSSRLTSVLRLRSGVKVPSLTDGPVAVLGAIRDIRVRLDQMEELLSQLIRLRGSLRRVARRAQETVDDAWAEKVAAPGGRPARGDFSDPAPRERYALADLAVLNQRREQRVQGDLADEAAEAVEVAQLAYRGLSDMRRDMHTMLRGIEIESSLER